MTIAGPPPSPGVRPLTESEFRLYQDLIRREAGIFLGPHKKALLVARLGGRVRQLGLTRFHDYYRKLAEDDEERVRMLDAICTNETSFFRERAQFDFLERQVLPAWRAAADADRRARRIRVWSAACSTGEEPYSLAMSLLWHCPAEAGWRVEVLGSDLSTRAIERAREGVWPVEKAGSIPEPYLRRFMLKGVRDQEGRVSAGSDLREAVRFLRLNLNREPYEVAGGFDLVFCRNVLIYFTPETRRQVVGRLLDLMAPGGYLFLGHAESLTGLSPDLRGVFPTVYATAGATGGRR